VHSVSIHPDAVQEYVAAFRWYHERSPGVALRFEANAEQALMFVASHPEASPLCDEVHRYRKSGGIRMVSYIESSAKRSLSSRSRMTDNSRAFGSIAREWGSRNPVHLLLREWHGTEEQIRLIMLLRHEPTDDRRGEHIDAEARDG